MTASGSAPNFTTNPPANGTVFPLYESAYAVTATSGTPFTPTGGVTATLQGTQTVNGVTEGIVELKIPSLGIDVPNLVTNGTAVSVPNGGTVSFQTNTLNYSLFGAWNVTPSSVGGAAYFGFGISGYQTPASAVPTTGTATYVGNSATSGGVSGLLLVPSSSGTLTEGTIQGQVSLSVNFLSAQVQGSLTNMTVTPTAGGPATAWNSATINATISGASVTGQVTSNFAVPPGNLSFDSTAEGHFNGVLFGPAGQELGAVWSLYDETIGGKLAIGVLGATKQ